MAVILTATELELMLEVEVEAEVEVDEDEVVVEDLSGPVDTTTSEEMLDAEIEVAEMASVVSEMVPVGAVARTTISIRSPSKTFLHTTRR